MKTSSVLLTLSLVANAGFLVIHFQSASKPATSFAPPAAAATKPLLDPNAPLSPAQIAETWKKLQAGDPTTLDQRLRAAGLPAAAVRAIMKSRASDSPDGVLSSIDPTPTAASSLSTAARATLNAARTALSDYERQRYGDLPPEKIRQLRAIENDYSSLTLDVRKPAGTTLLPEEREKLAFLEREKKKDLAAVLTPAELEDYLIRTTMPARLLRTELDVFKPTDDEFRALFRAVSPVDEKYGPFGSGVVSTMDQFRERNAAMMAEAQKTFSPERFAEYQRATNPTYRDLDRLMTRLELPTSRTDDAIAVKTDIQQRYTAIRSNRSLSPDVRSAQINALAQEATTRLTDVLTPRGFEAYQQGSGVWLRSLQPPASRP